MAQAFLGRGKGTSYLLDSARLNAASRPELSPKRWFRKGCARFNPLSTSVWASADSGLYATAFFNWAFANFL